MNVKSDHTCMICCESDALLEYIPEPGYVLVVFELSASAI